MNSGAVVTIEATQEKLTLGGKCFISSIFNCRSNSDYFFTKRQLQNGVVDAFTHVMEQYLTYTRCFITRPNFGKYFTNAN